MIKDYRRMSLVLYVILVIVWGIIGNHGFEPTMAVVIAPVCVMYVTMRGVELMLE